MASANATFQDVRSQILTGNTAPVYLLHGEEGYFIDELVRDFESLVPEDVRDFNLYTIYAPETDMPTVEEICRKFPMMAERQVVILKEGQAIRADQLNYLHHYAEHPNPQTVLVICCRGAQAKGKDLLDALKKNGVTFLSKRLSDRDVLGAIASIAKEKGLSVDPKAQMMLRDFIGTDLAKLYSEIDKLALILGKGAMITPEAIERNVGISKDYNNFELVAAINSRNALKAFRIVEYFRNNPKTNPTVVTVSTLFGHFSNILIYHYTADKTQSGYMNALGLRQPWQLRKTETGARNYSVRQTIEIISAIRQCDARTKGIGSRMGEYDLLYDLVFRTLTARGIIEV
ncbi:MAG: DNA polymerase III subunit delta [Duncaniella sp.]|nr:DNA polymerase III subunit delta [Duncaniella sp.]